MVFGNIETVPCTERSHFLLIGPALERLLGDFGCQVTKEFESNFILPENDIRAITILGIYGNIMRALNRNIQLKKSTKSQTSHLKELEWEVTVLKNTDSNAECLPNGCIFVNMGVLLNRNEDFVAANVNEDFVAAVIAHEVFVFVFFSFLFFSFLVLY